MTYKAVYLVGHKKDLQVVYQLSPSLAVPGYISHRKFRRDQVSVKNFTETLFVKITERAKLCLAETFRKLNFLHIFLNSSY